MLRNKTNTDGFTLVEVIIAMVVLLIGLLALLNTAAVVIQNNLVNIIRDEAVNVAEATMSDIRNTPFDSIASAPATNITRYFRGIQVNFSVTTTVNSVGTGDTKSVQVVVSWTYKGVPYQHSISTLINTG